MSKIDNCPDMTLPKIEDPTGQSHLYRVGAAHPV